MSMSMNKKIKDRDLTNKNENFASKCYFSDENSINVIGETLLHIAITYGDIDSIKVLLEKKSYDVNSRCSNDKLMNGFKDNSDLIKQAKHGGLAYFGEYPLALAAYFENKEIYDFLLEKGADPNLQGIYKNYLFAIFTAEPM